MVYMNHIVANLKLLYLLECQSHFTATGLVALKVVLMESVEYLMIGKEAHFQVVVDETFVQCFVNGGKTDDALFSLCLSTLGENIFQTFVLLGAISKDIKLIALLQIGIERLEQQLEILMKEWLYRDVKTNDATIRHRRTMTKLNTTELFGQRHKLRTCDERHFFLETGIDSITYIKIILGCDDRILW